jgi:hypothetical protein
VVRDDRRGGGDRRHRGARTRDLRERAAARAARRPAGARAHDALPREARR